MRGRRERTATTSGRGATPSMYCRDAEDWRGREGGELTAPNDPGTGRDAAVYVTPRIGGARGWREHTAPNAPGTGRNAVYENCELLRIGGGEREANSPRQTPPGRGATPSMRTANCAETPRLAGARGCRNHRARRPRDGAQRRLRELRTAEDWREREGVEPTAPTAGLPPDGFEDRESHQALSAPTP